MAHKRALTGVNVTDDDHIDVLLGQLCVVEDAVIDERVKDVELRSWELLERSILWLDSSFSWFITVEKLLRYFVSKFILFLLRGDQRGHRFVDIKIIVD